MDDPAIKTADCRLFKIVERSTSTTERASPGGMLRTRIPSPLQPSPRLPVVSRIVVSRSVRAPSRTSTAASRVRSMTLLSGDLRATRDDQRARCRQSREPPRLSGSIRRCAWRAQCSALLSVMSSASSPLPGATNPGAGDDRSPARLDRSDFRSMRATESRSNRAGARDVQ